MFENNKKIDIIKVMETNGSLLINALKADENFKILLVDDDVILLEFLKRVIENACSFEVFTAQTPGIAIELVENNDFDLMIIDYFLPFITGLDLIKSIRESDKNIPAIIISGNIIPDILIESINSNLVFRFLKKPIKNKELIGSIYDALEIEMLKKENRRYKEELETKNEMLEEYKFRLQSVLLNITDGVLILYPDGKIDLMNKKIEHLFFGKDKDDYNLFSIYDITGFEFIKERISFFSDSEFENYKFEDEIDDDIYSIYLSKFRSGEKLLGISCIFIDVTKEKEVDKLKMEFVANVSHELKTPLASIQGFSELLLKNQNIPKEKQHDFINIVFKESLRLSKMVNSILDLSKIEFAKDKIVKEDINLPQLIDEIVFLLKDRASAKNISLSFDESEIIRENFVVYSNRELLKEVLINLTENGIKYTQNDGFVKIRCFANGKKKYVSILDNGVGIPEEEHKNIFKKFYRVKNSKEKGTGLGLSIVKSICEKLDINIALKSSLGKGSEFSLEL